MSLLEEFVKERSRIKIQMLEKSGVDCKKHILEFEEKHKESYIKNKFGENK